MKLRDPKIIPTTEAGLFEGDIMLLDEQKSLNDSIKLTGRGGIFESEHSQWPNAVVPYIISYQFSKYILAQNGLFMDYAMILNIFISCLKSAKKAAMLAIK